MLHCGGKGSEIDAAETGGELGEFGGAFGPVAVKARQIALLMFDQRSGGLDQGLVGEGLAGIVGANGEPAVFPLLVGVPERTGVEKINPDPEWIGGYIRRGRRSRSGGFAHRWVRHNT